MDEATSALQKAIRRCDVDGACYWTAEMFEAYPFHVWRRLKIILSEDIGVAEPTMPSTIHALHETFREQREEKRGSGILPTMHAVILMARARKSRLVNNAMIAHSDEAESFRLVPDVALDKHTKRGREMGRSRDHFQNEAAMLVDPETGELTAEGSIPDPYVERARRVLADDGKERR